MAYPIQVHYLTHQNKIQSHSSSFKGVSSKLKYTKKILKNTKEKLRIRIFQFFALEEDLKILKVEYLNIHWSDLLQILNLSFGDQTKIKNADDLQWKTTSKYLMWNISAFTGQISLKFET